MSIINKMHDDIKSAQTSPILATMPVKKNQKKQVLMALVTFLTCSSLVLLFLILNNKKISLVSTHEILEPAMARVSINTVQQAPAIKSALVESEAVLVIKEPFVNLAQIKNTKIAEKQIASATPQAIITKVKAIDKKANKKTEVNRTNVNVIRTLAEPLPSSPQVISQPQVLPVLAIAQTTITAKKESKLEIKTVNLSNAELANIHLKAALKAQQAGNFELMASKQEHALRLQPNLNEVRKSLALYYYGLDDTRHAISLLKKGVFLFPEYADFSLMLSRIALKSNQQDKAYLYLAQHPPAVQGHLDYHVSYAILAQKFGYFDESEKLYTGLLTQRPNNGRWRMSLAIAQDKQKKTKLAIYNYKIALQQTDLSFKAKKYIKQRLSYLAQS